MSGIYTAAMGMITGMTRLDVHSNNIANVNTKGYKSDQATSRVFDETFQRMEVGSASTRIGRYHDEVYLDSIHTDFAAGSIHQTEGAFDVALHDAPGAGVSFFAVEKNGVEYLTRNGQFLVNEDRELVTAHGARVLNDQNQPIVIEEGAAFSVLENGVIMLHTGETVATMKLHTVREQDTGLLEKKFGGLFQVMTRERVEQAFGSLPTILSKMEQNGTLQSVFKGEKTLLEAMQTGQWEIARPFTGSVLGGMLEESNVNMAQEMVQLMNTQREVQSNQKAFSVLDEILQKEANEIGK